MRSWRASGRERTPHRGVPTRRPYRAVAPENGPWFRLDRSICCFGEFGEPLGGERTTICSKMKTRPLALIVTVLALASAGILRAEAVVENLAPQAKVSASSQFSREYRPEMAISGTIPSEFQQDRDWAVRGTPDGQFTLEWDEPVEAARSSTSRVTSPLLECFKDYEVYLDDDAEAGRAGHARASPRTADDQLPQAAGHHDPHRVPLVASRFAQPGRRGDRRVRDAGDRRSSWPRCGSRRRRRRPRPRRCAGNCSTASSGSSDILLVKRKPLNISHVYVYHVEGFRPGGGLYVFSPDEDGRRAEVHLRCRRGHDHHGRPVLRRQGGRLRPAARRARRLQPGGPHRRHLALRGRREQLPDLPDQHRRHRPDATDRTARTTTSTPAGCPTAASPSSPTASRPTPTATWSPRRCSTAWSATARTRSGSRPTT